MSKDEKLGLIYLFIGISMFERADSVLLKIVAIVFLGVGYYMFMYGGAHLTQRAADLCQECGTPRIVGEDKCRVCGTSR